VNETLVGIQAVGVTHVGQRKHNEDAYYIDIAQGITLVADGVGGHDAGEVASAITCEVIAREVGAQASVTDAVRSANREVMEAVAQGRGKTGMASTVVAVHLVGVQYQIAWVGDSRAYLWDGQLKLLTQDHSYVQSLLAQGRITLEEARDHPRKNVIVQAIGLQGNDVLEVGENSGSLAAGQILLLCSDGLSDVVDSARISEILMAQGSLQQCCQALVDEAVRAGGRDNITVLLLAGPVQENSAVLSSPQIVWSYDPATGDYSGLPEQEITSPSVRRVMPKGASQKSSETTRVMSVDEVATLKRATPKKPSRRWVMWLVVIAAAASLVYSLGPGAQALERMFK